MIDGKDIAPIIIGKSGAKTPHDRFFYQQGGRLAAVRSGDWKLFVKGQLYNLNNDLAEKNNIAHANPKIVKKLRGYLDDFQKDLATNSRPVGLVQNPRTLVPRSGVKGEEAYKPTLSIK